MRLFPILFLLSMGCSTAPWFQRPDQAAQASTYTVSGTATIEALPDLADLVLVLSAEHRDPRAATEDVKRRQGQVIEAMLAAGLTKKDIVVSKVSLSPIHERIDEKTQRMRLRGYDARVTLTATTEAFETLPDLMEAAAAAGATETTSRLRVADLPALKQRAREEAARAARRKAEEMAGWFDVRLGAVRAIDEGSGSMGLDNNFLMNAYNPADHALDVVAGEAQTVTVTVTVTYELA